MERDTKLVCHIGSTRDPGRESDRTSLDWFFVNQRAHEMLATVKTSIANDHRWDRYKKYFNLYELVSSSTPDSPSTSSYSPTSRSFYKMIELLHDHHSDLTTLHPCKAAFLCDAPGGFVEAFMVYRKRTASNDPDGWIGKDVLHAISLIEDGPATPKKTVGDMCPSWRIPRDMLRNNNVHLHGGDPDNNGDLYNIRNVDDFVGKVGPHSCELVTADGGFDFSGDFNNQEGSSLRLMVSQVYTALCTLVNGGALLMKVYDISLPATLRLVWHLHCAFPGGVVVDKPFTSRVANSEKFLVCKWFERTPRVNRLIESLRVSVRRSRGEVPTVSGGLQLPPPWFLRELAVFNLRYITAQSRAIVETVTYMRTSGELAYPHATLQRAAARRWCLRHGISMWKDATPPQSQVVAQPSGPPVMCPSGTGDQASTGPSERAGTADTQRPVRYRSRSPSDTPYKDGLLFPGRKLLGANCAEPPGAGLAEAVLNAVA